MFLLFKIRKYCSQDYDLVWICSWDYIKSRAEEVRLFFFARFEPHKGNLPHHSDKSYFNKILIIYFRVVFNAKMCFYFG